MGADCCDPCDLSDPHRGNAAYRRVLWAVLAINAVTFAVEVGAGLAADRRRCRQMPSIFSAMRRKPAPWPVRNRPRPNVRSWGEPVTPDWRE